MADDENVMLLMPGDIIGLYDSGNYQIGDTLYQIKLNLRLTFIYSEILLRFQ